MQQELERNAEAVLSGLGGTAGQRSRMMEIIQNNCITNVKLTKSKFYTPISYGSVSKHLREEKMCPCVDAKYNSFNSSRFLAVYLTSNN